MERYLETAEKFYAEALAEFERSKGDGNEILIRDAAEKAWNAMVHATNQVFEAKKMPVPQSHYERRKGLIELSKIDIKIEEKALKDRFMARCGALHEDCFYGGIYDLSDLEKEFRKVKLYMEDVKELCGL